jgi:hypothetical protein
VPLANPFDSPQFLEFVALRAWTVLIFVFLLLRRVILVSKGSRAIAARIIGALGLVLVIWGAEWAYTMLISSYVPAIGLALITFALLEDRRSPTNFYIIFTLIAVAKAPIIAISLLTLLFLGLAKRWRPNLFTFILSITLIFASVATWIFGPRGPSSNDTAFSFMGVSLDNSGAGLEISWELYEWAASFTRLAGWIPDYSMNLAESTIASAPRPLVFLLTAVSVIWLLLKYFTVYFVSRNYAFGWNFSNIGPLDVWALGTLISILFVRNGESLSLGHQAHSFILLAVPTSILAAHYLTTTKKQLLVLKRRQASLAIAATVFVLGLGSASSPITNRTASESAISLSQAKQEFSEIRLNGEFIEPDPARYSRLQVIAALTNSKLAYIPNAISYSQGDRFIIHPN